MKSIKKRITKIILFALAINLTSCVPYSYFQVYELNSENTKNTKNSTNMLSFENDDIIISYNFWGQNGNEDFFIYNKTDSNIFIDLGLSHLIINGNAYTYYQNREWSKKKTTSASFSNTNTISSDYYYLSYPYAYPFNASVSNKTRISTSSQNGITYIESRIIVIPPNSQKKINGFNLNNILIANCMVNKYPKRSKNISIIDFNFNDTPFKYENYITYSFNEEINHKKTIKNNFWIKKITFLPYSEFYNKKYDVNCGVRDYSPTLYYNYAKSNRFFIEYTNNSKFINLIEAKNERNSINKFKIGDKVIFKDTFNSFEALIVKIDGKYYYIEYKNKKGITKTKKTSAIWLRKIK